MSDTYSERIGMPVPVSPSIEICHPEEAIWLQQASAGAHWPESRLENRYALQLECEIFQRRGRRRARRSIAVTLNWTRNSMLLQCAGKFREESEIELVVRWMEGVDLLVTGRVQAAARRGLLIQIVRRRFRASDARKRVFDLFAAPVASGLLQ